MTEKSNPKCRTCLKNNNKTFPLSMKAVECNPKLTLGQLLQKYANLECPDFEHLMPQYLCFSCCSDLCNAYRFIRQAQYCNNKLANIISKQLESLQENAIVMPQNDNGRMAPALSIKMEDDMDDGYSTNVRRNAFKNVNTNNLLKSELLEDNAMETLPAPRQHNIDNVEQVNTNDHQDDTIHITYHQSSATNSQILLVSSNIDNNSIQQSSYSSTKTKCPICDKTLAPQDNLITHIRVQHDVKDPGKFLKSSAETQTSSIYNNQKCLKVKSIKEKIRKQKSQNKIIKCNLCDYTTKFYSGLNVHKRSRHGTEEDKFKCKFCSYSSIKKFSLLMHVKKSHKELIKTLKAEAGCNIDERNTIAEITTSLKEATGFGHNYDQNTPLEQQHKISITNYEKNTNLELSDEIFIRNLIDIKKRRVNKNTSNYLPQRCEECGKIYNNNAALKVHQKTVHITDDKYQLCSDCGKKFKNKKALRVHIKNFHAFKNPEDSVTSISGRKMKDKRFMCTQCSYVCGTITTLNIHTNRHHTGDKPYKCDICSKSFVVKYDLKIHRYMHTGERPYKCGFCSKGFRVTAQLIKHKRIHTKERPYKCKDCDKTFTQAYNLTLHKRTHLKAQKLNCTICNTFFENQSLLNLHRINENHHEEVE